MNAQNTTPLLALENVSKRYGATKALDAVHFDVRVGEVHALMGENGAGKSTLMKILAGTVMKDEGRIVLDGEEIEIRSPHDAAKHGISIIHQELNTVATMTVAENLSLGREPHNRLGMLDRRAMIAEARRKLERVGTHISPTRELGRLSVGVQQMVEIARALSEGPRVLVLDEPTAALSRGESTKLYELIDELRAAGVALIYISHRMEEVWRLADRVTVFRDGRYVGTRNREEIEPQDVVRMMVGRDVEDLYKHGSHATKEPVLEVRGLKGEGVGPVDLTVEAGEVVALAGLIGSGRTELVRTIFGADLRTAGTVSVNGRETRVGGPTGAIKAGIAMVPEDRKRDGLFLEHTVERNVAISSLKSHSPGGVVQAGAVRRLVLQQMAALNIRRSAVSLPAKALSGGNQQKVVLARWLARKADVLILDEPTRGVDIGAKKEIYEAIEALAAEGKAILIVSSDLPEALGISDRLLVMRQGTVVHEAASSTLTEEDVMLHATGTAHAVGGAA